MEFTAKLAGLNVGISSMYDEIYDLCHDYLTDGKPDFCISATAEDIRLERQQDTAVPSQLQYGFRSGIHGI